MLHVGDHVGGFSQHRVQRVVGQGVDEPPPRMAHRGAVQPRRLEQLHRLVLQASLGQGDSQPSAHTVSRLSIPSSKTSTSAAPFSRARDRVLSSVRQGDSSQLPAGLPSTSANARESWPGP